MEIIYNPYFSARPYVGDEPMFDTLAAGSQALLEQLELRAGCSGIRPSDVDRLVAYAAAMREALAKDSSLFFAGSFATDELGTAKVILFWRDALVSAMWDKDKRATEKFAGIAAVEERFSSPGIPDRWRALLSRLKGGMPDLDGLTVRCMVPQEALEPCVAEALIALQDKGVAVVYDGCPEAMAAAGTALRTVQDTLLAAGNAGAGKAALPGDGTFRHVHFRYAYDACQWVAGQLAKPQGKLLVTDVPGKLNAVLELLDRPKVAASASGYPQSEQLFLLGLALFRRPVDVNTLLSYLRVTPNPLGKLHVRNERRDGTEYYVALNHELERRLLKNSGLEGWDELLDGPFYDKDGKAFKDKTKDDVLKCFRMWETSTDDGTVSKEALTDFLTTLRKWADTCAVAIEDAGYAVLSSLCSAMLSYVASAEWDIRVEMLEKWGASLLVPVALKTDKAEAGAVDAVSDVRDILGSPDDVLWLGCVGADTTKDPYAFLSDEERRLLGIPDGEKVSRFAHETMVSALCRAGKSLTLVSYDIVDGQPCDAHPLTVELAAGLEYGIVKGEDIRNDLLRDGVPAPETARRPEYRVKPSLYAGLKKEFGKEGSLRRENESASSLDVLVQRPFDYVVNYLSMLEPYGEDQLRDMQIVKGLVAHKYVEELVKLGDANPARMREVHAKRFAELADAAARDVGAVLLLDENGLEFIRFKELIRRSVGRLIALIERNGWQIEGTEVEVKTELPVIGPFYGKIDILLKDRRGDYVVIDCKTNEGSWYDKKIESRRLFQLALYAEAVSRKYGARVSVVGYWMFPAHNFLTESWCAIDAQEDVKVFNAPSTGKNHGLEDIFKQICNSYGFRMEQLQKGVIEEGEQMALADLEYYQAQEKNNLYPLEADYKQDDIKAVAYGNTNHILKGNLE
ncbi:MAG: PD-(D/E)XK nuclease family protein [Bacteroidales bacterium]|nr:PD-(D/E)XK nuclease family protein [Bacteroidales bacterium]